MRFNTVEKSEQLLCRKNKRKATGDPFTVQRTNSHWLICWSVVWSVVYWYSSNILLWLLCLVPYPLNEKQSNEKQWWWWKKNDKNYCFVLWKHSWLAPTSVANANHIICGCLTISREKYLYLKIKMIKIISIDPYMAKLKSRRRKEIVRVMTAYSAWKLHIVLTSKACVVIHSKIKSCQNCCVPTCGCRQGDGCAPLVSPLWSQTESVAHSRSQAGQDMAGCGGWDLLLLNLPISRDVHQPVAIDLGTRLLPLQSEGGFCGVGCLETSGRIDVWQQRHEEGQAKQKKNCLTVKQYIFKSPLVLCAQHNL